MHNNVDLDKFENEGVVGLDNFLNVQDAQKLKKIVNNHCRSKIDKGNSFPIKKIDILKNIKNPKKFFDIFSIYSIYKKYKLKEFAQNITKSKVELMVIDGYVSKKSNENVLNWHVDQAYSGKYNVTNFVDPRNSIIKFFFYLSDVQSNNGCLGYIPGSHKIAFYLKELIKKGEISYKPYWALKDLRNQVRDKEVYTKLKKYLSENILEGFLDKSNFIDNEKLDTKKYDFPMNRGGLLVFDEAGVHRGSCPSLSDRYVIRFFFKKIN